MVSRLKHENVLELVGYCVEGSLRLLAYEFATMGSLHDILHGMWENGTEVCVGIILHFMHGLFRFKGWFSISYLAPFFITLAGNNKFAK